MESKIEDWALCGMKRGETLAPKMKQKSSCVPQSWIVQTLGILLFLALIRTQSAFAQVHSMLQS